MPRRNEGESARAGFEVLRRRYLAGVPGRVAAVKRAAGEAQRRWPSRDGLEALRQLAHRLVGSAEIFGVPRVSEAARSLEELAGRLLGGGSGVQELEELAASLEAAWSEAARSLRRPRGR